MLLTTPAPLLLSAALLSTTSFAALTQITCQCDLVSDAFYAPIDSPFNPSTATDPCRALGPELDKIRYTQRGLYESYLGQSKTYPHRLITYPARTESNDDVPSSQPPLQRTLCRGPSHSTTPSYRPFLTLWTSQVMLVFAFIACAAEILLTGLDYLIQYYSSDNEDDDDSKTDTPVITAHGQLRCDEKSLLAIAAPPLMEDAADACAGEKERLLI